VNIVNYFQFLYYTLLRYKVKLTLKEIYCCMQLFFIIYLHLRRFERHRHPKCIRFGGSADAKWRVDSIGVHAAPEGSECIGIVFPRERVAKWSRSAAAGI